MPLNREEKLFLEQKNKDNIDLAKLDLSAARNYFMQVMKKGSAKRPLANIIDVDIFTGKQKIKLRVYQPTKANFQKPIMLFCHGGGFVLGDLEAYDYDCRNYAAMLDCIVVCVEYRLAPENKYPAAVEDCYAACKWIHENLTIVGGDIHKLFIAGDSAGGHIAASVLLKNMVDNKYKFQLQLLIYPMIDFSRSTESHQLYKEGYNLTAKTLLWCYEQYSYGSTNRAPILFNLNKEQLRKFPKTIIITAEYDPLRDEAEIFCLKLRTAGISTEHKRFNGTIHGFLSLPTLLPIAQHGIDFMAKSIKHHFNNLC